MKRDPLRVYFAAEIRIYSDMLQLGNLVRPIRFQWVHRLHSYGRVMHYFDSQIKAYHHLLMLRTDVPEARADWVLAHEFRHIWQSATGLLSFQGRWNRIWRGQKIDWRTMEYKKLPWEIDADLFADHAIGKINLSNYLEAQA